MDSISKRFENQIKQNLQQPYVPSILSRPSKKKVPSENQQMTINGVQNRNSQEENPATSSEIPSDAWEKAAGNRNFGHAENSVWNNIPSYVNLLAMAEKGASVASSPALYQNHYAGSNMSSNTPSYGFHASNGHSDRGSLPMRGSVCETVPAQHFAPATPNLGKQIHQDNENQHEVIEITESSATEQSSQHSPSQVESSSAVRNATENEGQKFGQEVGDIDLNATPALPKKRRKKHRPKVVIEGKPKSTPRPKTPKVGESKTVKRKYVRKKGVQANENPLVSPKDDADPTWTPAPKRVLEFEVESESRETNHTASLDHQQGLQSCNVVESSSSPWGLSLNSEYPAPPDFSGTGIRSGIQNRSIRRRKPTQGQGVVVENTPSCVQFDLNLCGDDCPSFQESQEDTNTTVSKSTNTCLNKDDIGYSRKPPSRGIKRQYYQAIDKTHPHSMNIHGAQLNSMPMYPKVFTGKDLLLDAITVLFPHQKKRRTEKGQSTVTASTSTSRRSCRDGEKQSQDWGQIQTNTTSGTHIMNGQSVDVRGHLSNLQSSPLMLKFGQMGSKKQRTKTSSRRRSRASLAALIEPNQFPSTPPKVESDKGGKRRNDVYGWESQANMLHAKITRKRTKRVPHKVDSASAYEHQIALFDMQYRKSFTISRGSLGDIPSLDQLIQRFYSISIDHESTRRTRDVITPFATPAIPFAHTPAIMHENNEIVPFGRTPAIMQEYNAIVPYDQGRGFNSKALVPVEPKKPRKPRAKVDMDPETDRAWKQLMGKECDQGEETDVDKEKWWQEERSVFRGRADSFIARMHLIQGDRRFTKWKGSVVDSVIGVFLTQNVSDHLSSSAFMSLAARFPLQSTSNHRTCYEHGTEVIVEEPDEPEQCHENLSAEPVYDQGSITEIEHVREYYSLGSNIPSSSLLLKNKHVVDHQGERDSVEEDAAIEIQHFVQGEYIRTAEDANSSGSSICSSIIHNAEQFVAMGGTNACLADTKDSTAVEHTVSSQNSVISSQTSESSVIQTTELIGSSSGSNSEAEDTVIALDAAGPFTQLLQMANAKQLPGCFTDAKYHSEPDNSRTSLERPGAPTDSYPPTSNSNLSVPESGSNYPLQMIPDLCILDAESLKARGQESTGQDRSSQVNSPEMAKNNNEILNDSPTSAQGPPAVQSLYSSFRQDTCKEFQAERSKNLVPGNSLLMERGDPVETLLQARNSEVQQESSSLPEYPRENSDDEESTYLMASQNKRIESNLNGHIHSSEKAFSETTVIASVDTPKAKRKSVKEKKQEDWDSLRKDACLKGEQRKRTADTMDTLDYEAVRCAEVSEIAKTIRERGMNNMLAERIKAFLNRIVEDHGSIDLEWLRDIAPDKAKDYLLSIRGLGLKSVECVRLLTLHQLAFPVDTNVGRIAVRLGWVPLQPLPEEVQLHLLELYPMLESIQKYLWPRLCKLDQPTLYELHYQMITFGKVFCTKHKPNCNACPMRAECRHFASAFASARLALPAPQEKGIVASNVPLGDHSQAGVVKGPRLSLQEPSFTTGIPYGTQCRTNQCEHQDLSMREIYPTNMCEHQDFSLEASSRTNQCEPIIEVPASPEPESIEATLSDIEDAFLNGDPDEEEIPTIDLNIEEFTLTLQNHFQWTNMQVHIDAVSNALVASKGPSIPEPKLKNVGRLRTEHRVYELPDNHILLRGRDTREPDDPSPYMLAIWTPGEIADSTLPGEQNCVMQGTGTLCNNETCCSCNSAREKDIVRGTLLIPCRTAMKGSFPLNGTYFQVNEVFADHDSSRNPIEVPRSYIWNLPRRIVYFGTSVTSIFKGLTADVIQSAFWRGFVCVRGFDQQARAPRPLYARLHLAASKMGKNGAKIPEE